MPANEALVMKENILGYMVDALNTQNCVNDIFSTLMRNQDNVQQCAWLACLNPHSYAVALNDDLFLQSLNDANWLIPDGEGVVLASRILGGRIRERVTGSDVFSSLHQRMNTKAGMSVFFLGATDETLRLIQERMARDYPNVRVAGTYSPLFKPTYSDDELNEMISAVNAAAPDVLWVGMTAPKQEKWIYENRSRLNVKFAGAIGAVFDFYTGRVKRSHPMFQRLGLEWLPRLMQQPRRLWRRMFVSAPIFVWHVLKQRAGLL
jgi:N-acetylglucosaminyldiphosphoundecaprenol N-acetyl-beta-D-mannosaminyltransferase